MASSLYKPSDSLYLWYLGNPLHPIFVGTISLVLTGMRGVSLRYGPSWRQTGFALSENLPLLDMEHLPIEKDTAAGAVDDARPDRWGERVIKLTERPPRLSLLEMLYFAGDDRFGALGVSTSSETYATHLSGPLPQLGEVDEVHALVHKVLAGERVPETARRFIAPGATMGGARPKALIDIDGEQWVLKFSEDDRSSEPLIEHASMTLAARAGITVAQTRPVPLARGVAVAIKRFDRAPGARVHALSAKVALQAAGVEMSYPDLMKMTYQTDQIKESELKKITDNLKKTQGMPAPMASLYSRASRLPAKEYLQLLDVSNPAERAALVPLTIQVQKRYLAKAKKDETPDERQRDPVFQRFLNMIPRSGGQPHAA